MERIALPRGVWLYDPATPLGARGGFGAVYAGTAAGHGELAVKRLHLSANDAAHREMRIATDLAGRSLNHVINVFDAGEDADSAAYFVVMPRADKSLQQDISNGKRFSDEETATTLLAITDGLLEVADIVHRDLKPANILFHEGNWKVADFGIARFVEDSTSLQTLKGCLTPQYAAPEQWQYLHATSATDVYALGCIGYALLTGNPPFTAGTEEQLREQHLHADPPELHCSPRLRSIITMMLRKPADARPNLRRVRTLLAEFVQHPPEPAAPEAFGALAEAAADVARAHAEAERRHQQELTVSAARSQLASTGRKILRDITDRLLDRISREAPIAERSQSAIELGRGVLQVSLQGGRGYREEAAEPVGAFPRSGWDVVAAEEIVVNQRQPKYSWSASLWYVRLPNTADYRWYEVSYFSALRAEGAAPYSLTRSIEDADLAAAPIMHIYQLAFGPVPIDDENEDDFAERWVALLALASQGKLGYPSRLPLQSHFWRQAFTV